MSSINIKKIESFYRNRTSQPMGPHRFFSVLVPFIEVEGELYLLFEERATGNIMAPGEICFPGGHLEPGESPDRCALRETEEELGLPRERIKYIGRGDTLYGFSNYTLYTAVGEISYEDFLDLEPDPVEVAEPFIVKVSEFMEKPPFIHHSNAVVDRSDFPYELAGITEDYPWSIGNWNTVIYNVKDGVGATGKDRIVWGLTGGIVKHVMDQLEEIQSVFR